MKHLKYILLGLKIMLPIMAISGVIFFLASINPLILFPILILFCIWFIGRDNETTKC